MRLRLGTNLTLVLAFASLAAGSQWVSYRVSSDLLEQTVREREIDKIKTVGRSIDGLIRQQEQNVSFVARLEVAQHVLAQALARREPQDNALMVKDMNGTFAVAQVDSIELIDISGVVVYRPHDPQRKGDLARALGVPEALYGESSLTAESGPNGVTIRAIEPFRLGDKVVGAIAVGQLLNQRRLQSLSQAVGAELALLPHKGNAIASVDRLAQNIDMQAVTSAFEQKIPIYRADPVSHQTRIYLPILLVDQAFVMLAEVNSAAAYALLTQAAQRSAVYAGAILIASLLLAILMLGVTLRPLRSLRARGADCPGLDRLRDTRPRTRRDHRRGTGA